MIQYQLLVILSMFDDESIGELHATIRSSQSNRLRPFPKHKARNATIVDVPSHDPNQDVQLSLNLSLHLPFSNSSTI